PARSGREQHPGEPAAAVGAVVGLTPGRRGWRWWRRHLLAPLGLELVDVLELAVVQEDPAAVLALFDVDAVAVVGAHRAVALRALQHVIPPKSGRPAWLSRSRYVTAGANVDDPAAGGDEGRLDVVERASALPGLDHAERGQLDGQCPGRHVEGRAGGRAAG